MKKYLKKWNKNKWELRIDGENICIVAYSDILNEELDLTITSYIEECKRTESDDTIFFILEYYILKAKEMFNMLEYIVLSCDFLDEIFIKKVDNLLKTICSNKITVIELNKISEFIIVLDEIKSKTDDNFELIKYNFDEQKFSYGLMTKEGLIFDMFVGDIDIEEKMATLLLMSKTSEMEALLSDCLYRFRELGRYDLSKKIVDIIPFAG